jgi:hypothetical protein
MNGVSIGSIPDSVNYDGSRDLVIGNEANPINISEANGTAFGGYITYFTWVKGVALYTANFTVSNTYPTLTDKYILYLKAGNFAGSLGNTVINNDDNVSTIQMVPPNFVSNSDTSDTNTPQVQNRISLKIAMSFLTPLGALIDLFVFYWMIKSSSRKLKYIFYICDIADYLPT